jgi:Protein of unknown function (DUF1810)
MMDQTTKSALEILGSPDDLKFRSCLTLFREAASDKSDRVLFTARARPAVLDMMSKGTTNMKRFKATISRCSRNSTELANDWSFKIAVAERC